MKESARILSVQLDTIFRDVLIHVMPQIKVENISKTTKAFFILSPRQEPNEINHSSALSPIELSCLFLNVI